MHFCYEMQQSNKNSYQMPTVHLSTMVLPVFCKCLKSAVVQDFLGLHPRPLQFLAAGSAAAEID